MLAPASRRRSLDRAEESREVVHLRVVEELGADQQQRPVDPEFLPIVAPAEPSRRPPEELSGTEGMPSVSRGSSPDGTLLDAQLLGHRLTLPHH